MKEVFSKFILLLCLVVTPCFGQYTLTVKPTGQIVAPVTPSQFALANNLGQGSNLVQNVMTTNLITLGGGLVLSSGSVLSAPFAGGAYVGATALNVTNFGAVGNGVLRNGAYTTNGSVAVTVPTGTFTAGDVGKPIIIYGGSNQITGSNICTTIASVVTPTSITLAAQANFTAPAGGYPCVYGTDDTAAIQTGINFCCTNGLILYFPSNIYCIAGAVYDPGYWTNHINAQLYLPPMPAVQGSEMPTFTMEGPPGASVVQQTAFNQFTTAGATLWEMEYLANGEAMLSCPNFTTPVYHGVTGYAQYFYNAVKLRMVNMNIRVPRQNNMVAIDARQVSSQSWEHNYIAVGDPDGDAGTAVPENINALSMGVAFPQDYNAGNADTFDTFIEGFQIGMEMGEHGNYQQLTVYNCPIAAAAIDTLPHAPYFGICDFEACRVQFYNANHAINFLVCDYLTTEDASGWPSSGTCLASNAPGGLAFFGYITEENQSATDYPIYNSSFIVHAMPSYNTTAPMHDYGAAYSNSVGANLGELYVPSPTISWRTQTGSVGWIDHAANYMGASFSNLQGGIVGSRFGTTNGSPIVSLYGGSGQPPIEANGQSLFGNGAFNDPALGTATDVKLGGTGAFALFSWGIQASRTGFESLATNYSTWNHSSVGGTNTQPVNMQFNLALSGSGAGATGGNLVIYNNAGVPVSTNAVGPGTNCIVMPIIQPGGFYTNTAGLVTTNGAWAF